MFKITESYEELSNALFQRGGMLENYEFWGGMWSIYKV